MADDVRVELRGWKEIASRLNVSVRTVQRWEAELGLPVHRLQHQRGAVVVAFSDELQRWRETAGAWAGELQSAPGQVPDGPLEDQPAAPGVAESPAAGRSWLEARSLMALAGVGGLVVLVSTALVWLGRTSADGARAAAPVGAVAPASDVAVVKRGVIASSVLDEGRSVVVTVDVQRPSEAPDGKVDEGFLLQFDRAVPDLRVPVGFGELTIKSASLAVAGQDGRTVAFVVANREPRPPAAATVTPIVGLARYPEPGGVSHAAFVARISGM